MPHLRALAREHGLRGYSRLTKAELITFLWDNFQPMSSPRHPLKPIPYSMEGVQWSSMDVETFLKETRGSVANQIPEELQDFDLVKVHTTAWIQFKVEVRGEDGSVIKVDEVRKVFNNLMTVVFQGSNMGEIIEEMFTHMKMKVENTALANSRFVFDQVLFLDINLYKLNLTRGSSYFLLPDWISSKKVVINPKNEETEECFKWAIIMALHHEGIGNDLQRISKLREFEGDYNWRGLESSLIQ